MFRRPTPSSKPAADRTPQHRDSHKPVQGKTAATPAASVAKGSETALRQPTPPVFSGDRRMASVAMRGPSAAGQDVRKLTVGKDIALAGEINACDHLVVEGTVEAKVREGHRIEIAESGLFRGTVDIQQADIAGRFEGELLVHGRLKLRATGRIEGKVTYGELEVEAGGQIRGTVEVVEASKPSLSLDPTPAEA
ncbi:MAG: hypothetical protein A2018_01435 [Alphaproteobacteria bacterium GWF2_58_20]|nr:MAG: hypothetical protein A2018_01435 [Alphaproteobacteria bacterium GWF2_58_20]